MRKPWLRRLSIVLLFGLLIYGGSAPSIFESQADKKCRLIRVGMSLEQANEIFAGDNVDMWSTLADQRLVQWIFPDGSILRARFEFGLIASVEVYKVDTFAAFKDF